MAILGMGRIMNCPYCNGPIPPGATQCPGCWAPVSDDEVSVPAQSDCNAPTCFDDLSEVDGKKQEILGGTAGILAKAALGLGILFVCFPVSFGIGVVVLLVVVGTILSVVSNNRTALILNGITFALLFARLVLALAFHW